MTFSLVARCAQTGMFGMAVSSSSPAVAARCAYARAGVGAVASQNITDPTLGPMALDLMADGMSAAEAIAEVKARGAYIGYRQVLAVDRAGQTAIHSGDHVLGIWRTAQAPDVAAAGNLLDNPDVPQAIVDGFSATPGHLGDRLIAAMLAGLDAGEEDRGPGPRRAAAASAVGTATGHRPCRLDSSIDLPFPPQLSLTHSLFLRFSVTRYTA